MCTGPWDCGFCFRQRLGSRNVVAMRPASRSYAITSPLRRPSRTQSREGSEARQATFPGDEDGLEMSSAVSKSQAARSPCWVRAISRLAPKIREDMDPGAGC